MSLFNAVQFNKPKKNKFDLSQERKMSMKMGTLTPFFIQEAIPGDVFKVNTEMLLRLQPLLAPMMHRVRVKTDFFFVPNRLVWDEWQNFITGGEDGLANPVFPTLEINTTKRLKWVKGSLADYFGIPTVPGAGPAITNNAKVSALPFRAYQLIYNEYFRDQNLQTKVEIQKTSGAVADPEYDAIMQLRQRAWEKDYFTSALPFAQKGGSVVVPIESVITYKEAAEIYDGPSGLPAGAGTVESDGSGAIGVNPGSATVRIENIQSVDNGSTTINDLRTSSRLQEWLERNARAGSRYIESILAHFGVLSSDARLQRPEYLGGGQNPVVISEVLSTYQDPADPVYPQGNMSGHGISAGNVSGFKKAFEEHGHIIGIMTILPRTAYMQGVPRMFSRADKFDFAWPSFAQLGEQEIKNKELYYNAVGATAVGEETFGYQSRYAEYKFATSSIHGDFRDNLAFWHMARIFQDQPVLNDGFIASDPTTRVFAVEGETDNILVQLYNKVDVLRTLPYFNTPTL